jgi:hypothetical protein
VAACWRQRAASTICADGDGWRIDGPASADGRIRFAATAGAGTPMAGRARPASPA